MQLPIPIDISKVGQKALGKAKEARRTGLDWFEKKIGWPVSDIDMMAFLATLTADFRDDFTKTRPKGTHRKFEV